jgi:hypothetical protein
LLENFGYSLWLLCVVPVCGRTKKGVRDTIIFNFFILMMSPIASAPFFTFNFSRFQDDFLRVYLYFILERLIFTLKVPLVTEIFYYQRLMFEFARNVRTWPSAGQKKLSISTTPTMTKNRRLCCRRSPIFSAPSPTNQRQHPSRP